MTENSDDATPNKFASIAINIGAIIAAALAGRFLGIFGIAAIGVGWLVFNFSKQKLGVFFGLLVAGVCALAVYGFAAIGLEKILQ